MQTFGQYLVNEALPDDLRAKGALDKKELHKRLYVYAKRSPAEAAQAIDNLRQLGHNIATSEGTSITLNDITPDYRTRNNILRPVLKQFQKMEDPPVRQKMLVEAQERLRRATMVGFGGSQGETVRSGARGAPEQLTRSFMAPVAARNETGQLNPWLIHHSYSEGLRSSEHWAANTESRLNLISSHLSITEPGDLSKIMVNNMGDHLVLKEDCKTRNGITMSTDDPNIVDRFLAQPAGGFSGGTLITPQVWTQLRNKTKTATVRSPMTCELPEGVCQKCYGLDEKGKTHPLGTNVGIRSAQAITEPLTQFTLSARHGIRRGEATPSSMSGMKGLRQFLDIPKTFGNKAALSSSDGKVERIEKAPQGGFNVFVAGKPHYVPPHLNVSVVPGQKVLAGDALSDGIPMPNDVVKYKGLGAGRKYIVDKLQDTYKNQGVDLDRRHFEILARTHLNYVQIDDDPEGRFYPGEVVNYAVLKKQLAEDSKTVPLAKADGQVLAQAYLHHTAGTRVTPEIMAELRKQKVRTVEVARTPPAMSFVMQPLTSNPLLNPDWMARLGHRRLKSTLLEAAHEGQTTNLHGTHPIPAFAYGVEFGRGPGGKY